MSDPFDIDNLAEGDIPFDGPVENTAPAYMEGLNPPQRQAATTINGPLLVLAGAGTGKTRVLITRLAHILTTGSGFPGQILAVTFTNKAAAEMKERVGAIIGDAVEAMYWLGTFHAIGVKILRNHGNLVGLKSNFTILDSDDQLRLVKQIVRTHDIDEKRWNPRILAGLIDGWKNRGLLPSQVPGAEARNYAEGKGITLYAEYQARLKTLNAADFGDLILLCLVLFQNNPDVLADYQRRFRYILVDEYQDTNVAQYLLLRLLAQGHKNICCVGDDDQSIYGWRGAEVGNILRFEQDFKDAQIIRLEQNYRSTKHILGASGGLIEGNVGRLGKTLWTEREGGEKVTVNPVWDGREEARNIGEMIEDRQRKQQSLSEMAILVRAGFQTREFEERFLTLGIPYRIIGGFRFYERAEIRDVIAYLRHVHNPHDSLAFERIINVPKRGIGAATVNKLHNISRQDNCSLSDAAARIIQTDNLRGKARGTLSRLLDDFARWRDQAQDNDHIALTETILEESGYSDMWRMDKSPDAEGKLENLGELIRAMEPFEGLDEFLEHIALVMENSRNDTQDKISIMTLHGSKGLEFETVFLPGWEEDLFPSKKSLEEQGEKGLEEERRLAYVGLTRAKKEAHIFHVASRYLYGNYTSPIPSRFISELPADHVEFKPSQGMYGQETQKATAKGFSDSPRSWSQGYISPQLNRSKAKTGISQPRRKTATTSAYKISDRVFHDKFGYGVIMACDGNKLEVDFEKGSLRKIMDNFVSPA
ncbi:MAG: hypothetical protein COB49_01510 [Alphaproteobacteria bacterium]|nr:MAG: hypothetical protein COB49_01510 [Alphaproteobacteria bacterium]